MLLAEQGPVHGHTDDAWALPMWLIRAFEQGNVSGMLHTGLGQEATQAALAKHLTADDCLFPNHRGLTMEDGTLVARPFVDQDDTIDAGTVLAINAADAAEAEAIAAALAALGGQHS